MMSGQDFRKSKNGFRHQEFEFTRSLSGPFVQLCQTTRGAGQRLSNQDPISES